MQKGHSEPAVRKGLPSKDLFKIVFSCNLSGLYYAVVYMLDLAITLATINNSNQPVHCVLGKENKNLPMRALDRVTCSVTSKTLVFMPHLTKNLQIVKK